MKISWKRLLARIVLPLAVGGISGFLSRNGMKAFETLQKPSFSPPGWLFPVVWTILFVLMGIASYLIFASDAPQPAKRTALTLYGIQLAVNFFWSILFFNAKMYLIAFVWLVLLWILILATLILFFRIRKSAGILLLPYLFWVTFAGSLNFGIFLLNR